MTKITMNWHDLMLTAEGHADAGPAGTDIVCAGISAVTQSLLNCLIEANERGRTGLTWQLKENGKLRVAANPTMDCRAEIRNYFHMCIVGLQAIQENYPGHIKIIELKEAQ